MDSEEWNCSILMSCWLPVNAMHFGSWLGLCNALPFQSLALPQTVPPDYDQAFHSWYSNQGESIAIICNCCVFTGFLGYVFSSVRFFWNMFHRALSSPHDDSSSSDGFANHSVTSWPFYGLCAVVVWFKTNAQSLSMLSVMVLQSCPVFWSIAWIWLELAFVRSRWSGCGNLIVIMFYLRVVSSCPWIDDTTVAGTCVY